MSPLQRVTSWNPGRRWPALLSIWALGLAAGCFGSNAGTLTFSNFQLTDLTDRSVMISFDTSELTTCEVEYGLSADALNHHATDPSMDPEHLYHFEHSVPLSGLSPDTVYFYRGRAQTADGMLAHSEVQSFTTAPDSNPAGSIYAALPENGATVSAVSSNFGGGANDSTWGVLNAVDGDRGTQWASDGDGDAAFLTLDLGQQRSITELRFRSRKMADGSSIILSFQLVDASGVSLGSFDTPDPDSLYSFPLDPPIVTRIIGLQALTTSGGNTGAREIQLFSPR